MKTVNILKNVDKILFFGLFFKKNYFIYICSTWYYDFFLTIYLFAVGCMVPYKTRYCSLEIDSLVAHPSHLNSISFAMLQLGGNVCYTWAL